MPTNKPPERSLPAGRGWDMPFDPPPPLPADVAARFPSLKAWYDEFKEWFSLYHKNQNPRGR